MKSVYGYGPVSLTYRIALALTLLITLSHPATTAAEDDGCRTVMYDTGALDMSVQYVLYDLSKCDCLLPDVSPNGVILMKSFGDQSGEILWSAFSDFETTTQITLHDFDGDNIKEAIIVRAGTASKWGDIIRVSDSADTLIRLQHLELPEIDQNWQVDTATFMTYHNGSIRWFGALGDKVDWLIGHIDGGDSLIIEEIEAYPLSGDVRQIMREETNEEIMDEH